MNDDQTTNDSNAVGNRRLATGPAAPPPSGAASGSGHLGGFKLLRAPVKEGQCAECAVFHEPEMPHNQQSMFWQYHFMEKHGRWPTWTDAMAHCTPEMRAQWTQALAEHGVIVPNTQVEPRHHE